MNIFLRKGPLLLGLVCLGIGISNVLLPSILPLKQKGLPPQARTEVYLVSRCEAEKLCIADYDRDVISINRTALSAPILKNLKFVTFVMRAAPCSGGPADLFRLDLLLSPKGVPIRSGTFYNLTKSELADEMLLVNQDDWIAYASKIKNRFHSVSVMGFGQEPEELTQNWTREEKLRNRITNFQETGQQTGLTHQQYVFVMGPRALQLELDDDHRLRLIAGSLDPQITTIDLQTRIASGPLNVSYVKQFKGRKAWLLWTVDSVRNLSFIGAEKIALLERFVFTFADYLKRFHYEVTGSGEGNISVTAADIKNEQKRFFREAKGVEDLLLAGEVGRSRVWPPPRIKPLFKRGRKGEGVWVPMTDLVKKSPDGVPLFYETWLRPDEERPYAKVYITAWDAEKVDINVVQGTKEPPSITGVNGSGRIPRGDSILNLLAAFNGGFQHEHIHHGMMVKGELIQPPRRKSASVTRFTDGFIGFGTWGEQDDPMPDDLDAFRQNLTPLVDSGVFNPGRRRRWGWTPASSGSGVYTVRTGICLLGTGSIAYFWGKDVCGDTLGVAMITAGCTYGIHLDMNAGHSGFEYYQVYDREGSRYDVKRMFRHMSLMGHPRYIRTDARDFFYLSLRPSIFDRPLKSGWQWLTSDLKQMAPAQAQSLPGARMVWTRLGPDSKEETNSEGEVFIIKSESDIFSGGFIAYSPEFPAPDQLPGSVMIPVRLDMPGNDQIGISRNGQWVIGEDCEVLSCVDFVNVFNLTPDLLSDLPPEIKNSNFALVRDLDGFLYFVIASKPSLKLLLSGIRRLKYDAVFVWPSGEEPDVLTLQFPTNKQVTFPPVESELSGVFIYLNLSEADYPLRSGRMEPRFQIQR